MFGLELNYESMEIPHFYGDENKDAIIPMEWLGLVKEYGMNPSREENYFSGEAWKWWLSIDKDTRWNVTLKEFEKLFSDKWIRYTKMKALYIIQDELKEAKEEIKKKDDELFKIQDLNEALVKEVQKLKHGMSSKGK
jgi:hypothetical protein